MKVAVTATDRTLDAAVDPRFGRCPCFLIVETDDLSFEAVDNPNLTLGGGAGIQSAQLMAARGVQHVLTGNCGPNAHQTLSAAGIRVIIGCSGTVAEVIEQFKAGGLSAAGAPNVASKFGMGPASSAPTGDAAGGPAAFGPGAGGGMGMGGGGGMGMGGGGGMGMGRGGGRGMGRGGGRGMGMGGGMRQAGGMGAAGGGMPPQGAPAGGAGAPDELTLLKQQAEAMARQMEQIAQRIQQLEQEEKGG